jgi:hypothetical protein
MDTGRWQSVDVASIGHTVKDNYRRTPPGGAGAAAGNGAFCTRSDARILSHHSPRGIGDLPLAWSAVAAFLFSAARHERPSRFPGPVAGSKAQKFYTMARYGVSASCILLVRLRVASTHNQKFYDS